MPRPTQSAGRKRKAVLVVTCFGFLFLAVSMILRPSTFVRSVSVQFDWDQSQGFRNISVRRPSLGPFYSYLVAAQAKAQIASELEKARWTSGKGHWNVRAFLWLFVLGIDRSDAWDVETIDPEVTPLMRAAQDGDTGSVEQLISAGANVEARDQQGRTALLHAAIKGQEQTAKLLMAAGANPNISDHTGQTPFLWAADNCQEGLGMALVAAGAEVNTKDTVLNSALRYSRCPAVVRRIIDSVQVVGSKPKSPPTRRPGG